MHELYHKFIETRQQTEKLCKPLQIEDYVVQPITCVSPPKWHLAHTTWFFEQFILVKFAKNYVEFHPDFAFLFNSYYNNLGNRTQRQNRGFMTRPTVAEVFNYRKHVNKAIVELFNKPLNDEILMLIETGIQHEQQHHELLAYDIKYILGTQPTFPALGDFFQLEEEIQNQQYIDISEGIYEIGYDGNSFCFDNELGVHKQFVANFEISNKLVTNAEYLEFINDGGYQDFNLWHDDGWHFIQNEAVKCPLYWHFINGEWYHYTFQGLQKINMKLPVMHLCMYEAFAFAQWKGMRLPTEFEWEVASSQLKWGQLWEWTNSAYLAYPGYTKADGALGEYSGKFMINQMVLRGASIATPKGHVRKSYRNFFHASSRWLFSGIRLVKI